jgi:hypothetical protein
VVEGGPWILEGERPVRISLVNFHRPFDLYKVSWASRPGEQKRLDRGVNKAGSHHDAKPALTERDSNYMLDILH